MRLKYYKKTTGLAAIETVVAPPPDQVPSCQQHNVTVEYGAGTSAGTVVVEEASSASYAGTWVNLATMAWSAANKAHSASIVATKPAIRVRLSVGVVGGTVDVTIVGLG